MPDRPPRSTAPATGPSLGRALLEFLRTEAGGGVVLLVAALVAIGWANSPWRDAYHELWHHELVVGSGRWAVRESLQHWINDALMALFFFVVGLEIKRELACGELRDPRAATLPVMAAVGGMAVPAALFLLITGPGEAARGWGIPMATEIAFSVGVLAVLGPRVPRGLKVFVLTLAIVVWYCTYRSGIHPTIASVALGLLTPSGSAAGRPVLEDLEQRLHPWSSYVVIPVFALANAGVSLDRPALADALGSRLTWAVVLGLVAGNSSASPVPQALGHGPGLVAALVGAAVLRRATSPD